VKKAAALILMSFIFSRQLLAWGKQAPTDQNLFVLSWSPQYCSEISSGKKNTDRKNVDQCGEHRSFGFVIHGLWGPDEGSCSGGKRISEATLESMLDLMPSKGLMIHEWKKHGQCFGADPVKFFDRLRSLYAKVQQPERFKNPKASIEASEDELMGDFKKANPQWPADSFAIKCRGRDFGEFRICTNDKDEVTTCQRRQKSNCPTGKLLIRPLK
jgi:ribonuclease T2